MTNPSPMEQYVTAFDKLGQSLYGSKAWGRMQESRKESIKRAERNARIAHIAWYVGIAREVFLGLIIFILISCTTTCAIVGTIWLTTHAL
jgi:hypothetical protein